MRNITADDILATIYWEMSDSKYEDDFANKIINSKEFFLELCSRVERTDAEKEVERKMKKLIQEWQSKAA